LFINIDYNKRPKEAKLHLAKPNKRIISSIYEKFNDNMSVKLGNVSELNFSIPHFITDETSGETIINPHIELIKEKMLIRVTLGTYKEWYVVDEITEDVDDSDVFNVKSFSLPYELKGKRMSGFTTESMNATEILTQLLETTIWTIGTIDAMFNGMYRSFESGDDANVLDCIMQAGETFGALIEWDTINRKINFKDATKNGEFKGMTVSYGRFLRTLTRTRTTDEMITRMYVYGSEDLTIHSVNPTGQGYIEDFSFFIYPFERDANRNVIHSSHFMSDELCHALLDHKQLIEQNAQDIKTLTDSLLVKQTELNTEKSVFDTLESDLENILELLDVAKSAEDTAGITQRTTEKNNKEAEMLVQDAVVDGIEADIADIQSQLDAIQDEISQQANFTQALLDELNLYIIESTWRDDRYINAQELYDDAIKKFNEVRQPKVVIEVTIDNLLNIVEEQYYWDKLNLGDLIKIKYKQMNIEYMAKIIEINYDFEQGEATLIIANTTDLLSETDKLVQLLYSNSSASSLVQNNKYKWNKVNAVEERVSSLLTSEWDATKNKIIAGVNNSIEVGNRGIIIKNPDFPNEVVIMQSGVIALSKDSGETWKTAIKPDGIVAERLIGQIIAGDELLITNSNGTFTMDNNGAVFDVGAFIIRSSSGGNLLDDFIDSSNYVNAIKDDNLVTSYEKKMLKSEWDKIVLRYNSNVDKLGLYYADSGATLQFVIDYHNSYTSLYNYLFVQLQGDEPLLASTNMLNTTRIDSGVFGSKFSSFDTAQTALEAQLDIKAKEYAEGLIQDVQDNLDEVANDVVYKTELHSTNGDKFTNGNINTTLYVLVYRGMTDITSTLPNSAFIWKKTNQNGTSDTAWNNAHIGAGSSIQVTKDDVYKKATFWCDIDIP
jgi:hypothetical protein